MKEKCTFVISRLAFALELLITIAMLIGTGILCVRLFCSVFQLTNGDPFEAYQELLSYSMSLVIGVELIRMMYYHTSNMVFELLVFVLARQVIIDHSSAVTSLIGVCAIAVLFATKKYLSSHVLSADTDD